MIQHQQFDLCISLFEIFNMTFLSTSYYKKLDFL
uniref:Uncharacterized protein n=1 Tax=Arundo donax TaxID=35708 RepID=A0A0A8YPL7_ARUDO